MNTVGSVPGNGAGRGEAVQTLTTHYTSLWSRPRQPPGSRLRVWPEAAAVGSAPRLGLR